MKRFARVSLLMLVAGLVSSPARGGSIAGRVLDDSGKPIAGARVQWLPYRDDDHLLLDATSGKEPSPLGECRTDAAGRFHIVLENAVPVALRIDVSGFPSARLSGPFESMEDLPDIAFQRTLEVSGSVVDETGKPMSGARVSAVGREAFFQGDVQLVAEARTATDGTYSIPSAPMGARVLIAVATGFGRTAVAQIQPRGEERLVLKRGGAVRGLLMDAGGKPLAGAVVIADDFAAETDAFGRYRIAGILPGTRTVETIWQDFAARSDNVKIKEGEETEVPLKLARAASLTGSVVEEKTKKAIAGVRIAVYAAGATPFGRGAANLLGSGRTERSGRTDAQGRFQLGGLANRSYLVEASKDGYLPSSIPNVAVALNKSATTSIALRRAASVAGKVVDESGKPVPGAQVAVNEGFSFRTVRARGFAGAAPALLGQGVLTGPDGSFRLRNVMPAHNAELEASKIGFASARQLGVSMKPGDAPQGLTLVLKKGLKARGRVVDPQGRPVPGAELRMAIQEAGTRRNRPQIPQMAVDRDKPDSVSGPDGGFGLGGLSAGQYTATVTREGFSRKTVSSLEVKADSDNVWPAIELAPGVALAGLVKDSNGLAVVGAQILAIDPGEEGQPSAAVTGPDGRFQLGDLTAQRSLLLSVSADEYAGVQRSVTPPVTDLTITLMSLGAIRGRVEDANRNPVADFTVGRRAAGGGGWFLTPGSASSSDRPVHSDDGNFELSNVPPGKWTVHVSAEGYRSTDVSDIEVGDGAKKEGVVLSLKSGGSLSGRVLDSELGTGVANASVSYVSSAAGGGAGGPTMWLGVSPSEMTMTDANGSFSLDGLPDGKIIVTASHPDYLDAMSEVDATKESSVDLTLETGGGISGTVVGQDGRSPISGAQVWLNPDGNTSIPDGSSSASSDGTGNFLFDHLQGARYRLVAQSSEGRTITQRVSLADNQQLTGVLLQTAAGVLLQGTISGLPAGQLGGVQINSNGDNYGDNTTTDDSGKYSLRNVPIGVVRLNATTSFLLGRSTSKTVEIPDGSAQFTADIEFQGASRLSGRVTRGDSALSGVSVNASPIDPTPGAGSASAQTDDNGQYVVEGLSDGDYGVTLIGQGVSYRKTFTISGDTPGDIQLPPSQLSGAVAEAGSGEPLDRTTIRMQPQVTAGQSSPDSTLRLANGDSTGHYFIDDVDSGAYQVTARRDGYQAQAQNLTVGSDSATLNFSLQRGEGISIRVLDGLTGTPLNGIVVTAVDGGGSVGYQGSVALDSTGKGEINSLAPGRYAVHFFSDGYAATTSVINAPSPLVPIAMTPGGSVEVTTAVPLIGRIVDSSGFPYQLSPFRADGRVSGGPPVLVWDHVAPGSYQLLVGPTGAEVPYPFTVMEGQTVRLTVTAP